MRQLFRSIRDAWMFFSQHGFKTSLTSKEAPWLIQFAKYGACGVLATVIHNVIFAVLSKWVIPTELESLTPVEKAVRFNGNNLIAFVFSNAVAYGTNLLVVFQGGRHSRVKEFLMFSCISIIAMIPALVLGSLAILKGVETPWAQVIFVITSAMVNYLCRKFFVFKK
jgi:putative flippase GtrA